MAKKETYSEMLKHPKWQKKRLEVLQRDNFKCDKCGDEETELHIHHKERTAKDPRDEPIKNLVALCRICHFIVERDEKLFYTGSAINKVMLSDNCFIAISFKEGGTILSLYSFDLNSNLLEIIEGGTDKFKELFTQRFTESHKIEISQRIEQF